MKINSTPDVPVVYENPKHPIDSPYSEPQWYQEGPRAITQRIVRLSDPAYYCAENPHTDSEGFLPHDGGPMPEWLEGKIVQVKWLNGAVGTPDKAEVHIWGRTMQPIIAYRIVGEQEEPGKPELPQGTTKPAATDSWATDRPSTSENGDDPEQFVSGDPVPFVDKPRSSDASGEQSEEERRHRNELAARTLTPVPGMDDFMHDVIREARRQRYREVALQAISRRDGLGGDFSIYNQVHAIANTMTGKEDSE